MTFQQPVYAIDGGTITGQLYRLQLRSATQYQAGVVSPLDLEVRELTTPGTSVRILNGECVILGDAVVNQGSYYGFNSGDHELPIAATDASGPRSDMIAVQAQDPSYSGSSFTGDPATDVLVVPVVESNVAPDATGTSLVNAIPLARIDLPASTATVTQDMITDVRRVANPLSEYVQDSTQSTDSTGGTKDAGFANFQAFPLDAQWTVHVPSWATTVDLQVISYGVRLGNGGGFFGASHIQFGSWTGAQATFDQNWNGNPARFTIATGGTHHLSSAELDTDVVIRPLVASSDTAATGILTADHGTFTALAVMFRQIPVSTQGF
ncbi:MAG: hypothetical protein ACRDO8_06540 [Nocardioidaceae bacterium]